MQFNVGWSDLKAFAAQRGTPIQWILIKDLYCIAAIDGPLEVVAQIPKRAIAAPGSDQADFETNYKEAANSSPRGNVVQVLGKDQIALCPFGACNLNIKANDVTVWDIELPETCTLRGATIFAKGAVMGDWISVQVIDKNNIVGAGGTEDNPTLLGVYAISWYLAPDTDQKLEDVSISQTLPQGVFIRITYTSVGTTPPQVLMNFISYIGV